MKILAIETSCDDTCIAVAKCNRSGFGLLSNLISSQIEIHKKWGGVYPALARREHQKNLTPLLIKALKEAGLIKFLKKKNTINDLEIKNILKREELLYLELKKFLEKYQKPKIDLIAVTNGPGLDPCLWTGVNFAKTLAFAWDLPIIGVNHIEGHIFANLLSRVSSNFQFSIFNFQKKALPGVCLIASGGHTQIILIKKLGKYKIIGETRDDAAGEAFDKIARILGLSYPGGPAITAIAAKFSISNFQFPIKLPRPMMHSKDYDFSFSGLKTAVLYDYKKRNKKQRLSKKYIRAMAKEAQQAIVDVLIKKTIKAANDFGAKSIFLGGGVAANKLLRESFEKSIVEKKLSFQLHFCEPIYYTDNAAMIAATACFLFQKMKQSQKKQAKNWKIIKANPNLRLK